MFRFLSIWENLIQLPILKVLFICTLCTAIQFTYTFTRVTCIQKKHVSVITFTPVHTVQGILNPIEKIVRFKFRFRFSQIQVIYVAN